MKNQSTKHAKEFQMENKVLPFEKKPIKQIVEEAKKILPERVAKQVLIWAINNVENFISNQMKIFKIDLLLDSAECMPEVIKLQNLYRAIPEEDCSSDAKNESSSELTETEKISVETREMLDKITLKAFELIKADEELLRILFKRMAYYYELKGINKGQLLIQELDGNVAILKFEYEAFSVGVKVKTKENIIKEYVIPEGFTLWIEIALSQVAPPSSLF